MTKPTNTILKEDEKTTQLKVSMLQMLVDKARGGRKTVEEQWDRDEKVLFREDRQVFDTQGLLPARVIRR